MTEGDAMYREIVERPHDDAVRLIYADWLEDHGQGFRAEFIRLQIELEQDVGTDEDTGKVVRLRQTEESAGLKKGHQREVEA